MHCDEALEPNELAISSNDLQVMRHSFDTMQQQLSRGLREIHEMRDLFTEALKKVDRRNVTLTRC